MKKLVCATLVACGPGVEVRNERTDREPASQLAKKKKAEPCTVEETDFGATITCPDGSIVDIYHGQEGQDGLDGVDGSPGQDGQDGVDGADGTDGQDGVDGRDGQDAEDWRKFLCEEYQ